MSINVRTDTYYVSENSVSKDGLAYTSMNAIFYFGYTF